MSPTNNPTPQDVESAVVAWLTPLRRCAIERKSTDPLPFTLVREITGEEGESAGSYVVSVRTFVTRKSGVSVAAQAAAETHARMLLWSRTLDPVTINGRLVSPDFVKVFQTPTWVDYDDHQILCKLGRYDIGLTFTT